MDGNHKSLWGKVSLEMVLNLKLDCMFCQLWAQRLFVNCIKKGCPSKDFINIVEPQYNDPRYTDIPGITINMLFPGKSYSKMNGTEPWYNDLQYNDIPDIKMSF